MIIDPIVRIKHFYCPPESALHKVTIENYLLDKKTYAITTPVQADSPFHASVFYQWFLIAVNHKSIIVHRSTVLSNWIAVSIRNCIYRHNYVCDWNHWIRQNLISAH